MDIKRQWQKDTSGIGPALILVILAGSLIAGLGVYQLTQRPDITYNISDTGFSIAGLDISWVVIVGIGAVVVFVLFFIFRRPPRQAQAPQREVIIRRE